jgi:hypothetical protein
MEILNDINGTQVITDESVFHDGMFGNYGGMHVPPRSRENSMSWLMNSGRQSMTKALTTNMYITSKLLLAGRHRFFMQGIFLRQPEAGFILRERILIIQELIK